MNGTKIPNKDLISIYEEMGDEHILTSLETPMRPGAFDLTDEEKIAQIATHFEQIMNILGLDLTDDSLRGTPHRVAKMYVQEIFSGLNPGNKPAAALFENKYQYNQMLVEKNILVQSTCEHHFLPIYGRCHVRAFDDANSPGAPKGVGHGGYCCFNRCQAFVCIFSRY